MYKQSIQYKLTSFSSAHHTIHSKHLSVDNIQNKYQPIIMMQTSHGKNCLKSQQISGFVAGTKSVGVTDRLILCSRSPVFCRLLC